MTTPAALTVADVSEGELLARIFAILRDSSAALVGPGDDAAVLATPDGRVVATTDTLVHGPDFRLAWSSGFDLGVKSAAVNLADIAAMGARPIALLVALALPESTTVTFVEDFARGLRDACERLAPGCAVEGGDLTASETLTIAVTAMGVLDGHPPVLRSGARVGDVVAVTGELGAAARGLDILFTRFRGEDGRPLAIDRRVLESADLTAVDAQLRPAPPVGSGVSAARAGATAMMDVSDGLLLDATRMADASRVTIDFVGAFDDAALRGGEDHALLATFPASATPPPEFRVVGVVRPRGAKAVMINGMTPTGPGGWDPQRDWDRNSG